MTPPPLLDRLLRQVGPHPVADFAPRPAEIAAGVWGLDRQLRYPGGAHLPSRTTIIRLSGGELVILSPPALRGTEEAAAIDSIGIVRYVVAPNTFHYTYVAAFMVRYPDATLLAAPGLPERVPELPPAEELGPGPEAWSGELDLAVLGPVRGLSEVVFFHLPSRSLILTDLAFNLTRFERGLDRAAWRVGAGIPSGFGPGRTSRSLLLRDHAEARRCLRRVSEWPIERIVVAHGDVVEHDARDRFLKAFAAYLR